MKILYPDSISGYPDIRISGYPDSISETCLFRIPLPGKFPKPWSAIIWSLAIFPLYRVTSDAVDVRQLSQSYLCWWQPLFTRCTQLISRMQNFSFSGSQQVCVAERQLCHRSPDMGHRANQVCCNKYITSEM